jgi:hypothetical protein
LGRKVTKFNTKKVGCFHLVRSSGVFESCLAGVDRQGFGGMKQARGIFI